MKKINLLSKLANILFLVFLWLIPPHIGDAEIYKYIDNNGVIHFTDRYESVPKEYRQQIKTIKEKPSPQPPAPAALENEKEGLKKPEPPKIENIPSKSIEVISPEEEKNKAREEKERQIAEFKKQIEEKRKQQRSLRTNWMVYDRYTIIRLNQEIEALEKQIKTLQSEVEEEK